jgi:hypothetical protein
VPFYKNERIVLTVALFLTILLLAISCKECPTEPEPQKPEYEINSFALDYAGPSFVSLSFAISDSGSREYAIQRDSLIVLSGKLSGADTIVTDWNAEPSTTYQYRLQVIDQDEIIAKSDWISVTTMDTTSHDFTWEKIVLCNGGGYLEDIEMVDENNIWVVGEFFPEPDTGGCLFNAAHWDGNTWTLQQIKCSGTIYDILVFADDDIWVSSGLPYHWDGQEWTLYHLWDMGILTNADHSVYRMWGSSSNSMYFVGEGTVVHYDGTTFRKVTEVPKYNYYRINGIFNQSTNRMRVWIGAISLEVQGGALVYFNGQNWTTIWNKDDRFYPDPVYSTVGAIYIPKDSDKYLILYVGGSTDGIYGIHRINKLEDYFIFGKSKTGFIRSISGNGINDFFAVGDFNTLAHYNGKTFRYYTDLGAHPDFVAVAQKGDIVYVVEDVGAIVYKGTR